MDPAGDLGPSSTDRPDAAEDRRWTVPNALSALRLVLVPVFLWAILGRRDGLALGVLVVSGTTDYLDGHLARRWGQVSRLGRLLDPAADRLYILSTLGGLGVRGVLPWLLVVLLLARDLLLAAPLPLLARRGYGPPEVTYLGKAATFNLLSAFPLLLLAQAWPGAAAVARPAGWAFLLWGTSLYWWTAVQYLRQAAGALRAPAPRPTPALDPATAPTAAPTTDRDGDR